MYFCVFFSFFSQFSSFSFLLSLFLSSLFFPHFSLLFLFFFSLHFSQRRPTSRHLNVMWRTASAQQSVLSLLLSPPSSFLLSLPPLLKKKRGENFLLQEYFRRGIYFYYRKRLSPKNRRRVKLQSLQFKINSKTIGLQRVKTVIISAQMVSEARYCFQLHSSITTFFTITVTRCNHLYQCVLRNLLHPLRSLRGVTLSDLRGSHCVFLSVTVSVRHTNAFDRSSHRRGGICLCSHVNRSDECTFVSMSAVFVVVSSDTSWDSFFRRGSWIHGS